jgi:FkbM family methyltransferase
MSNAIAFLRHEHLVPPKGQGTLVDIGANNGITSVSLLHTGEMEKSIAIEPEPRNFSILQHNVIQNGLKDRVLCLPYAASHQKGELLFELSDSNFGDHRVHTDTLVDSSAERYNESSRRVIKVPSDTVDSLLASLPDTFTTSIAVVWIDVQGYEGYVFMGAEGLLSRGMPVVCEIWPYGIRQAGMSQEKYCDIAKSIWSYYWVMRRGKFVRYPIPILDTYFTELGYEGEFENVIFSH